MKEFAMSTQIYGNIVHRVLSLIYLNSRLLRSFSIALLLALGVVVICAAPTFAESPPSPNVLVDDYVSVPKDGSVDVDVLGNDTIPEFNSFDFTGPEFGRITSFTSNAFRKFLSFNYRPNRNYVGQDSFYYLVSDDAGRTLHAAVHITVYAELDCATCLIRHTATPINITIGGDGAFNFHFIGEEGVKSGPVLPSVRELAEMYTPDSGNIVLSSGENTVSGAPVVISYLSAEQVLHVNTSYLDRHNGSMKPYIFVINQDNEASHWEW